MMPAPLAVVGDQILTDGLLAWRLQSPFIQWELDRVLGMPIWPFIQKRIGYSLRHVIFTTIDSLEIDEG